MARFCTCVSQVLTKMVGRFAHQLFLAGLVILLDICIMSCHTFFHFRKKGNTKVPIHYTKIKNRSDLADFLRIPLNKFTHLLYVKKPDNCYSTFEIPKKNGDMRKISAPNDDLSSIQRNLSVELSKRQKEIWEGKNIHPNISHAFEKDKGIISNARVHRNKRFVLNLDLENFFGSIHFGRVRGFFMKNRDYKVPTEVATIIAQLCCFQGSLPQGAPSSPIITNLVCQIFDFHVLRLAKKFKLDYTRYADDLTFSTNDKKFLEIKDSFLENLELVIQANGFKINKSKTRLSYRSSKQMVTGLVVNKKLNVDRKYCRETNAMAYNLYKNGAFQIESQPGTINQLEGRYSFINQLDRYNNKIDKELYFSNQKTSNQFDRFSSRINIERHHFKNLNGRERQYQKFIFYKYFYGNTKPLIVTEGKTDIVYLKCAIKRLSVQYPELIAKKQDGTFEFNISFLKRTDRLNYFLDFSQDGADAMKRIYDLFKGLNNTPNLYNYFRQIKKPENPVFLLYDNEMVNNKPLKTFATYAKLSDEKQAALSEKHVLPVIEGSNLFVLTHQLVDSKKECEIEDLFDETTRTHIIDGKTLSLKKDAGKNGHYGKDTFAKYIASNYQSIDFTNFEPMLDSIVKTVKEYRESE